MIKQNMAEAKPYLIIRIYISLEYIFYHQNIIFFDDIASLEASLEIKFVEFYLFEFLLNIRASARPYNWKTGERSRLVSFPNMLKLTIG